MTAAATAAVNRLKSPAERWPGGAPLAVLLASAEFPPPGDDRPRRAVEVEFAAALVAAGWRKERHRNGGGRRGNAWLPPLPPLPPLPLPRLRRRGAAPPPPVAQSPAAGLVKDAGRALSSIQRPAVRWPDGVPLTEVMTAAEWPRPGDSRPAKAAAADFAAALHAAGWAKLPPRRVNGRLARLWQPPPDKPPPGPANKAAARPRPQEAVSSLAARLFNIGDRHTAPDAYRPPANLRPPRQRRGRR